MNIAIIGVGNVGGALARAWSAAGHHISLGLRDPQSDKHEAWKQLPNISLHTVREAALAAEVLLIALPIPKTVDVLNTLGDLSSKTVIDATNSVFGQPTPYAHTVDALRDINGVEAVKGFNTTGFENMADPRYGETTLDLFTAGANEAAKEIVKQLSVDAGFAHCYDFGGADKIPLIEQLALAWINLAILQKEGRNIGFKVLRR